MIKTIYECDIPLLDRHQKCGKHAATRQKCAIQIGIGNNLYFVCPDCAKLPLEELLDKIITNKDKE